MSSQKASTQKSTANGYVYNKGERSKEGAFELKSLYLDIDVKTGAYADTAAAAAALKAFMKATGLPRPTLIVATGGGGVHVHWVLDRALKVADWLTLAAALKNATKQHGLITDEGVTADAARILRVPDTVNWKYDHRPVATLGEGVLPNDYPVALIEQILLPYAAPVHQPNPSLPPSGTVHPFPGAPSLNSDLTAGLDNDGTFVFDEYEDVARYLLAKGAFDRGKYEAIRDFLFATAWAATAYPMLRDKLEALFKDISEAVPDRLPDVANKRWGQEMSRVAQRMSHGGRLLKPASIFKMAIDLGWTKPRPAPPPPGATTDLPPGYKRRSRDGTTGLGRAARQKRVDAALSSVAVSDGPSLAQRRTGDQLHHQDRPAPARRFPPDEGRFPQGDDGRRAGGAGHRLRVAKTGGGLTGVHRGLDHATTDRQQGLARAALRLGAGRRLRLQRQGAHAGGRG